MRALVMSLMAFSLIVGTAAMAAEGEDKDTTAKTDASAPAAKPADPAKAAAPAAASSALEAEMQQLRDLLESQARQLQLQNEELKEQQQKMQALEEQLKAAEARRENLSANPGAPESASNLAHVPSNPAGAAEAGSGAPPQAAQKAEETGPASIKYKGITITPGGFVAAETVYRTRAVSGDINTPFTGIPYPGNALSKVSENNFTARQSRLSLLGESKVGSAKLTGYYEADWLGTGVTSNNRQSNSYVMRQRTIWGQAAFDNGWSFTGGQMWSMRTDG